MSQEENRSGKSGSNTIGCSIGCGCLTTLGLLFVVYEYIYLRSLKDGYTSWQCVGFWINVLIGAPFVLAVVIVAFEGGFKLMHFLLSRIRLLWGKKDHGETKGSNPVDSVE